MDIFIWRWAAAGSMALGVAGLAVACGSSGSNPSSDGGTGVGQGEASATRDSSLGGSETSTLQRGDTDAKGDGELALDAGCVSSRAATTLVPAYLVFVMDRSDSMKQYGKWPACQAALESFFDDPSATGISASLTFMPDMVRTDGGVPDAPKASCTASDYATPSVTMTALPTGAFKPVIQAEKLGLGTPTQPALLGALTYAETVRAAHPGAKVLIVLATDGYPVGCASNKIGDVADAAAYARTAEGIPVYVIGVGPDTDANTGISNLNAIAEAGGTGSTFFIPTAVDGGDASITTTGFLAAVKTIQSELSCRYAIPTPPEGQQIDYDKVNVVLTTSGNESTLGYSMGCVNSSGWYYDYDDAGPQEIVLCPKACSEATAGGASSSVNIAFGCTTQGGTPPK